jgi:hypothetical protein
MKKTNKILTILGCAALGLAGIGVVSVLNSNATNLSRVDASTSGVENIDLTAGVLGTNVITYSSNSCVFTINKGSATNFYTSSVSTPRIYQKNYLRFEAAANYTISSISVTYTGTYKGASWAGETSATAGGASETVTTALAPADNTTNLVLTWSFSATDIVSATLINGVATGTTNVQLRPTAVSVSYTFSGTVVTPASISISGTNSVSVGGTTTLSATVYGSNGTSLANDQGVDWTISSGSDLAFISAGGVLTAFNAGIVSVKATSSSLSTVSATYTVTITSGTLTVSDKTLVYSDFLNAYTDGFQTIDGIVYNGTQVIGNTSYKEVVLGKTGGLIQNMTAFPSNLKKLTLTCYSTPTVTVKAGSSSSAVSSAITASISGSVYTYDLSGGSYKYLSIANGSTSATAGFYSAVIEMSSSTTENVALNGTRTFAQTFLTDTATECASLAVTSTNWTTIAAKWDSSYKTYFDAETKGVVVTDLQKALERYTYIVKKYNYTNFMGITLTPSAVVDSKPVSEDTGKIVAIASLGVLALATGAFFYFRKKKQA